MQLPPEAVIAPRLPSPVQWIDDPAISSAGISLALKREDLISEMAPGNKWRKLKRNIDEANRMGASTLLTFGGAYSNHLRAVAAVGRSLAFTTIGIVRGEEHQPLNPSLAFAVAHGMRLSYMDRSTYRRKTEPEVITALRAAYGDFYLIPEGGTNELAVEGCAELGAEIGGEPDVVCVPCGTGGTLAGVAAGLVPHQRALGFCVLKGAHHLDDDVRGLQERTFGTRRGRWRISHEFHCGGFAKRDVALNGFIDAFHARHGVALEHVYVAKMLLGVFTMARRGEFAPGTQVMAVVTG